MIEISIREEKDIDVIKRRYLLSFNNVKFFNIKPKHIVGDICKG